MYQTDMQVINFYNEIEKMMFGFGDSHKPNPETVRLVESITLSQLRLIIQEATKYQNDESILNGEELVFLMRKNKYKMRRFIKYLQNKELKPKGNILDTTPKPKHPLVEFIEQIDETGELTDINQYDEVKYERMIRADRISLCLNEENYIKFSNARRMSFVSKNMSQLREFDKLKQWIDPKNKMNFSTHALEVLSYYAYETVAQITDYALLVRLDHNRKADPLSNLQGTHFSASMFNGEHQLGGQNPDYSRVYSGQPAISVAEIKEVMRRVSMPQAGKLNLGKRLPQAQHIVAI